MVLALPNSIFLHAAKTGGSWVRQAISNAGIPSHEVGDFHAPSVTTAGDRFVFTFVRNPLDWYASYWRCPHHRQRIPEGRNTHLHDAHTASEAADFGTWLARLLADLRARRRDGEHLFSGYVQSADFVGKQEMLIENLVEALQLAGEQFDEQALRETRPNNVSTLAMPQYSVAEVMDVIDTERSLIEQFGYATDPDAFLDRRMR